MSEDRTDAAWRKSTRSSGTGSDCVEVAAVWEERD
jgi:hypothetical protein